MSHGVAIMLAAYLPVGPATVVDTSVPVVHWRIELFRVPDAVDSRRKVNSEDGALPHISDSTQFNQLQPASAYAPPMKSTDRNWGPETLRLINSESVINAAEVTLVQDDDLVDLNGLSVRVRSWRAFEVLDSTETPLDKSKRVNYVWAPSILTFADGRKAEFCSTIASPPVGGVGLPEEKRAWTWTATAAAVACDRADDEVVSVRNFRLGDWKIANNAGSAGVQGGHAYPITARACAEASFWLSPRQTAVVRLPRTNGDSGQTFALVKAFIAGTSASEQLRKGVEAGDPGAKPTQPFPAPMRLPLLETP